MNMHVYPLRVATNNACNTCTRTCKQSLNGESVQNQLFSSFLIHKLFKASCCAWEETHSPFYINFTIKSGGEPADITLLTTEHQVSEAIRNSPEIPAGAYLQTP